MSVQLRLRISLGVLIGLLLVIAFALAGTPAPDLKVVNVLRAEDGTVTGFGSVRSVSAGAGDNGRVVFQILFRDNGPGIHAGLWNRIFEAGYTTRADGSGIGLYISWNLMEEMGGRIYVKESHILSGTTFCLEIPYHL